MIQQQTYVDIADNSGAKQAMCINVLGGSSSRGKFKRKVAAHEFSSEAEMAAFGREYSWQLTTHGRMWLGKQVLLGGRWDGEIDL